MNEQAETKMQSIRMPSLDNVNLESALFFRKLEFERFPQKSYHSIGRILLNLISSTISIEIKHDAETAFLFSNSYRHRQDHFITMKKLVSIFDSYVFFFPGKRKIRLGNIRYIGSVFSWIRKMLKQYPLNEALALSLDLLIAVSNTDQVEKIIKKQGCKRLIVFSDMHTVDSVLVQRCNQEGICTATLQHGNFETAEPFILSESKYFLCYGKYTKDKAIRFGMDPSKLIMCGVLKDIGQPRQESICLHGRIRSLGVILSGYNVISEETTLLKMLINYCSKNDLEIFVKLHPGMSITDYPEVEWKRVNRIIGNEITVQQMQKNIDVAVFYSSTVFIEYVMNLFPSLLYKTNGDAFYESIDWCKFDNEEALNSLMELIQVDGGKYEEYLKETRSYFSAAKDTEQAYKEAILSLK